MLWLSTGGNWLKWIRFVESLLGCGPTLGQAVSAQEDPGGHHDLPADETLQCAEECSGLDTSRDNLEHRV